MSLRGTVAVVLGLAACQPDVKDPTDGSSDSDALSIAGTYTDEFGTDHVITEESWTQSYGDYPASAFEVVDWDDDQQFLIAHNEPANPYNPDAWSRFDWSDERDAAGDGPLYYCQTAFDAPDRDAAEATPRAGDGDPASSGCGGFAWTNLQP